MAYRICDWDKHFENCNSRKLKRLEWVAIPNKMDGSGYTALVDHPNGAAHLGAWYAIVEIASRREIRGTLPDGIGRKSQDIGGICQSLGRISRLPASVFVEVMPRLIEIGWVEQYQSVTETSGESADASGDSADTSGENVSTGKGMEGNIKPSSPAVAAEENLDSQDLLFGNGMCIVPKRETLTATQDGWFDLEFWPAYWRKVDKAEGKKAFRKHASSQEIKNRIIAAVKGQYAYYASREEQHRPHAATWLNKKRYEESTSDQPAIIPAQSTAPGIGPDGKAKPGWSPDGKVKYFDGKTITG